MKATDLLVGDIIYRPDCYDEVVEIRLNGIIGKDSNRGLIPFDEIRPIEITPEILEKIGFESQHNVGYVLEHYDDNTIIVDLWDHTLKILMNYKVVFEKEYFDEIPLHELQHALHLCGIEKEIIL